MAISVSRDIFDYWAQIQGYHEIIFNIEILLHMPPRKEHNSHVLDGAS